MSDKIDALIENVRKATTSVAHRGDWEAFRFYDKKLGRDVFGVDDEMGETVFRFVGEPTIEDLEFLDAVTPHAVLEILEHLEQLQMKLDSLEGNYS